jgi:putative transferase (TIGR04331 family)
MFLAVTADQRFWKKDEKIFFLGEWCRIFSQEQVWSKLSHEVFPYHWENRDKYYQDFLVLDDVYERCLEQLSESLNILHNEDWSTRRWRIIIGPWLYYFIEIFYDRYFSIRTAIDSGKVSKTWIPSQAPDKCVPKDFTTFQTWHCEDGYNQYLYGWLIRALGGISYEVKDADLQLSQSKFFQKAFKKNLARFGRLIPKDLNKIIFVSSYLKPRDLLRMQISLGQLPNPCTPWPETKDVLPDLEMRKKISLLLGRNEFETLLNELIPLQIPTVYIEGYAEMRQVAHSSFPRQPEVIFSLNALYANEGFKFWAADQVEGGVKLIGGQHGGHYGCSLWSTNESHEAKVADRYYTWGWEDADHPKKIPFTSGQLAGTNRSIGFDSNGGILWLGLSRPRYSSWTFSAPVGLQMLEYVESQMVFLEKLLREPRDLLIMRLFPADFGWEVQKRLSRRFPDLYFDSKEKTMYQQLCRSRLCIGTYNATTNLETLSANFPTIAFWDFDHWKLRESAKPYFDDMREVGIFHDNPESAAIKVNEVYEDPLSWWNSKIIKEARNRFCHRFARTSENWIFEWKQEFQRLSASRKL